MGKKQSEASLNKTILQVIGEQKPATVKQLIEQVRQQDGSLTEQEITGQILRLQNEGKITFKKRFTPEPERLIKYLRSSNAYWYWVTILLTLATILVVFTVPENAYPLVYVRYVLGSIFVLWLPGYTFIKALFPAKVPIKTSSETLDIIERIALSIGLSLALVPIVGLLLNYTPWGIRLTPIVLSLLALTITSSTVAAIREYGANLEKVPSQ